MSSEDRHGKSHNLASKHNAQERGEKCFIFSYKVHPVIEKHNQSWVFPLKLFLEKKKRSQTTYNARGYGAYSIAIF